MRKSYPVAVSGMGMYAPARVLTNADLEKMVETNDEWIVTRTGIRERHIIAEGECTSDMATQAARQAIQHAGLGPQDIDMVVAATMTPDYFCPSMACLIQHKLGIPQAPAFDLAAACTGFVYGLWTAEQYVRSGARKNVLVVAAEAVSRFIDWEDRHTCVLFGDGAGAAVVSRSEGEEGILSCSLGADGSGAFDLYRPAGGAALGFGPETVEKKLHYLQMNGAEIFKFAVRIIEQSVDEVLRGAELSLDDIDWFVPHQANARIIEAAAARLKIPMSKVIVNVDRYGNTSAASVPTALCEAVHDGRIERGQLALMTAFGAGLTWGSAIIRWVR